MQLVESGSPEIRFYLGWIRVACWPIVFVIRDSIQFAAEPSSRQFPIAFHSRVPDAQNLGRLFYRESPKEAQFDDPALLRIHNSQFIQGIMHGQKIRIRLSGNTIRIRQREAVAVGAAALGCVALAGMVDQNAAHQLGGNTQELRAVLPSRLPLVHQPQIGFVDQCGGLQRMPRVLPPQIVGS